MAKISIVFAAAIKKGSLFDPRPFFADTADRPGISQYRKGQIIFSQGDRADAVFYIEKGIVKVAVHSQPGKRAVIAILQAGDFFGEECLTGHQRRMTTVSAMTGCSTLRLEAAAVVQALRERSKFSELFVSYLSARKIQTEDDLVDQLLNSSEKRLARRLLILAGSGKERRPKPAVTARINQDTLAAMIGTTQARVSFFMTKFRRLGLIDSGRELQVRDSLRRAVLSD